MDGDRIISMYDAIKSKTEQGTVSQQKENYFTEVIGFIWDYSDDFRKIFLKFLLKKEVSKEALDEYNLITQEYYPVKKGGKNTKKRNVPDIIIEKNGKDEILIENKIDSNDYKNYEDYLNDFKNIKKKILIISKYNQYAEKIKSIKRRKNSIIKYWQELYELIDKSSFKFKNEIISCMEDFSINQINLNIEDEKIKTFLNLFLELKSKSNNGIALQKFVNDGSHSLRLNKLTNDGIIPIKVNGSNDTYNLYLFLDYIIEKKKHKIYFNISYEDCPETITSLFTKNKFSSNYSYHYVNKQNIIYFPLYEKTEKNTKWVFNRKEFNKICNKIKKQGKLKCIDSKSILDFLYNLKKRLQKYKTLKINFFELFEFYDKLGRLLDNSKIKEIEKHLKKVKKPEYEIKKIKECSRYKEVIKIIEEECQSTKKNKR
ncbi:hypothetical protein K9M79_01805 [Candidatus Woesearchaeota archaeon]|nr:hypothetical protein [Candidatus Woesearchaeota archaeon]